MTDSARTEPDLRNRSHWIFDMDGTLTRAVHDFEAIRRELGLPAGEPILEVLDKMPTEQAALMHQRLDEIEFELAAKATPQPGAEELLSTLIEAGIQIGILTRNGEAIARRTLEACDLLRFFDTRHVIGRDSCPPKPNPDGVHKLLRLWTAEPGNAVVIGDYVFDLQAGRNAGTATIYLDVDNTRQWHEHADMTVQSLEQISVYLQ